MAVYYVDSSALVKCYVQEIGSAWALNLVDISSRNEIFIAELTVVEVIAALARQRKSNNFSPQDAAFAMAAARLDVLRFFKVEMTRTLLNSAAGLADRHSLRAYDAVQLASVVHLRNERAILGLAPMVLVSSDMELNSAATAEGLTVDDPNQHP